MQKLAFGSVSLFFLTSSLLAQERPINNWIVDDAHLLNRQQLIEVQKVSQEIEKQHSIRLALATLSTLEVDPRDKAIEIVNNWQLGPKAVLLLITVTPKKLYIQPGNSLANVLTTQVCTDLCKNIIAPKMKSGDYGAAVTDGFQAINLKLYPIEKTPKQTQPISRGLETEDNILLCLLGICITLIVSFVIYRVLSATPTPRPSPYFSLSDDDPYPSLPPIRPPYPPTEFTQKPKSKPRPISSSSSSISTPSPHIPYNDGGADFLTGYAYGSGISDSHSSSSHHDSSSSSPSYDPGPSSFDASSFDCGGFGGGGSDW